MKRILTVFLVAFSIATPLAAAQMEEWRSLMEAGNRQRLAGNYPAAVDKFRAAVQVAEHTGSQSFQMAASLNGLATANEFLGNTAEAEKEYQRALTFVDKVTNGPSVAKSQILVNYSGIYVHRGEVTRAEAMLREAISGYIEVGGPDNLRIAVAKSCLAETLLRTKSLKEAEGLIKESIGVFEKGPGVYDGHLAAAINNLGVIRLYQGRKTEALALMEHAIAISEKSTSPTHPSLINPLANLGAIYQKMGLNAQAEVFFHRATQIAEQRLGPSSPTYAAMLMSYAQCIRKIGRKSEAKDMEAKATELLHDNARTNGLGMTVDVASFRAGK